MKSWVRGAAVLVAGLTLSACVSSGRYSRGDGPPLTVEEANAAAPFLPPLPPVVVSGQLAPPDDPEILKDRNVLPAHWPLRFNQAVNFGVRCFNTESCNIIFDGLAFDRPKPIRFIGNPYSPISIRNWNATQSSHSFDDPVSVSWRSLDGAQHRTLIDLTEIFKGRRVLHVVPRDEVAPLDDGKYEHVPGILVEVNDRTINVYMRSYIPTRHLQRSGRPLSDFRWDLILARSYHF